MPARINLVNTSEARKKYDANIMQFFSKLKHDTNECAFTLGSRELLYVVNIKRHDVVINVAVCCET